MAKSCAFLDTSDKILGSFANFNINEDKEGVNINTKKERINKKGVCLYQDRTQDDNKTSKRFERDYELLMQDHYLNILEKDILMEK